ncbi:MAG: transcriptional regulator [Planctomycetota bacterium]|nr:MAG: transcriptional regulator [Planctomycetota bacterium]
MNSEEKRLYKLKADIIAAVGNPIRLAIIDFLKDGEQCVCDITDHVAAKRSNVSRHLGVLMQAGLVSQRKDGLRMMYSLRTTCILNFMKCIDGVIRAQAKDAAMLLRTL